MTFRKVFCAPTCVGRAVWPCKLQCWITQKLNFLCQSISLLFIVLGIYNFESKGYSSGEMFGNDEKFDPCKMYALHETGIDSENSITNVQCHSESFDNGTVMACESYVYDTTIFPETLTTSFNLVSKVFLNTYLPTLNSSMIIDGV